MVTLHLTDDEAQHLKDVLDAWVNGHDDAKDDVTTDPTFEEPEEMLEEVDSLESQFREAIEIRQKLVIAMRKGDD